MAKTVKRFEIPKRDLVRLYQKHSTEQIGQMYGVSAEVIRRRLHEHGIKSRSVGSRRVFDPPKGELAALYQQMSMSGIAAKYGVGETVVWKRLKEHGIELHGYEGGGHRLKPGKQFSAEHLARMRAGAKARRGKFAGPNSPNWKGGATAASLAVRSSGAYKEWKNRSLDRAGYVCEGCGARHREVCECCGTRVLLHVHHVLPFATHVDRRFDPENSEVLCPKCHRSRHESKSGEFGENPNVKTRAIPS